MQKLQHFTGFTTFQLAKIEMTDHALRVCLFLLEKSFYKHGVCTASLSEIADACFYSKSNHSLKIAIPSYLSELEKLEIIKIKKEKGVTNTYKLLDLEYAKKFTKDSASKKVEKKEVKKVYKKPLKPVQTQQVTQVHEEKQVQVQAHKVQTRPQFCDEIAAEWVAWRREKGLENGFPLEEYATYIHNAYAILPVQNYDFWMRKIFEFIKQSEFWGEQGACSTPYMLLKKHEGSKKILKIFEQMQSSKNKQKYTQEKVEDIIEKDDPNYRVFCQEIPF